MTKSIKILEDVTEDIELVDLLRRIADMVEEGYTSGYSPTWEIVENND